MPRTPNHESRTHPHAGDADIARIASLIGDPTRAKVLLTLIDGRALTASRLAAEAGVSASTISEHLTKLCEANLLMYERSGRSRHFRLLDPSVARALEALAEIAPPNPYVRCGKVLKPVRCAGHGPAATTFGPPRLHSDDRAAPPRPHRNRRRPPHCSGSPWFSSFNVSQQVGILLGETGGYEEGGPNSGTPSYSPVWTANGFGALVVYADYNT